MKNSKSIFLFAAMPLIFSALSSMSGCHPCGGGDYNPAFQITRVDAVPIRVNGHLFEQQSGDSVKVQNDSLVFRADFIAQNVVQQRSKGFSFFPEAVACSPVEPYYIHNIDSADIIALDDWDAAHPAGSSLEDIARAKHLFMLTGWTADTTFIAWKHQLQNIQSGRELQFNGGSLLMLKAPQFANARFYFMLKWSDPQNPGRVIELRSQPLRVVK